ncbi:unnamed protein product, partial [Rhizophagus irregularis]
QYALNITFLNTFILVVLK